MWGHACCCCTTKAWVPKGFPSFSSSGPRKTAAGSVRTDGGPPAVCDVLKCLGLPPSATPGKGRDLRLSSALVNADACTERMVMLAGAVGEASSVEVGPEPLGERPSVASRGEGRRSRDEDAPCDAAIGRPNRIAAAKAGFPPALGVPANPHSF